MWILRSIYRIIPTTSRCISTFPIETFYLRKVHKLAKRPAVTVIVIVVALIIGGSAVISNSGNHSSIFNKTRTNFPDKLPVLPSTTTQPVVPVVRVANPWQKGMKQLGIDLYAPISSTDGSLVQIRTISDKVMEHIVSLGANSVSISFPFLTSGLSSDSLFAGCDNTGCTPSTLQLSVMIQAAEALGLRVTLRPLMSQSNLGGTNWRGNITPTDIPAWFTSYEQFLQPYLVMAQPLGVATFIIGAELSSLAKYPEWESLVSDARNLFRAELAYSSNFDVFHDGDPTPTVDRQGVDTYFPVMVSSDASIAQLQEGWNSWWN